MRRVVVVLLGLGMALVTVAFIVVAVLATAIYWAWITLHDWAAPVAFAVFLLPFVMLLAAVFAWELRDV